MTSGLTGPMLATVKLLLRAGSMSPYDTIPRIYMVQYSDELFIWLDEGIPSVVIQWSDD